MSKPQRCLALGLLILLNLGCASLAETAPAMPSDLPLPSSLPLQDYENLLYRWLFAGEYRDLPGWVVDEEVRDTGPFVNGISYGIHPAVRIYYSPGVAEWLAAGREGPIADGEIIVKEMFNPPAAMYHELLKESDDPDALLGALVSSWAVMVKDSKASKDGWFWSSPGAPKPEQTISEAVAANLDRGTSVNTSGFGLYTCMRCHSSAAGEFTFSSQKNIDGTPLQFRVDNSWRNKSYTEGVLDKAEPFLGPDARKSLESLFYLPNSLRPWLQQYVDYLGSHAPPPPSTPESEAEELWLPNPDFAAMFGQLSLTPPAGVATFPSQWSDHVYPGPDGPGKTATGPYQYFTSDTCVGCHGGLGGSPYSVAMFVKTGPQYGNGYNVSEYGEWRWSPMGLAGRDPIFHSQLECEMILLIQDAHRPNGENPIVGDAQANMHAVLDTCLSCHGAMGRRQLELDADAGQVLPSGAPLSADMSTDYYYLTERLASDEALPSPPPHSTSIPAGGSGDDRPEPLPDFRYASNEDYYSYHRYGELAREGISCMVCHHIAPPTEKKVLPWVMETASRHPGWITDPSSWVQELAYLLFKNNTGRFESGPGDHLYGPLEDVATLPMENAFGITPVAAPAAFGSSTPFISDSQMCGTCHTINLPTLGEKDDPYPILTAAEQNDVLKPYPHSIEQATFLEWQNSDFGPGVDGKGDPQTFRSCQDCHMPGGLQLPGELEIEQLSTQIATIQDQGYPEVDYLAPRDEITVPVRDDYKRHELVGLNAFLVEMVNQFPQVLGVDLVDYETSASTGADLALKNMLRQAKYETVTLELSGGPQSVAPRFDPATQTLTAEVTITNLTGHRFPSGVAFRRAFLEIAVLEDDDVIWISGATNGAGVILGPDGKPLPTEFLDQPGRKIPRYQPHYQTITRQDQVQIYEELVLNARDEFTTSFIHRVTPVKDNRLLPKGWVPSWRFAEQGELMVEFMAATDPEGASVTGYVEGEPVTADPNGDTFDVPDRNYVDSNIGSDSLKVKVDFSALETNPLRNPENPNLSLRVTAYSQSLMPAWLHQRFSQAAWAKAQGYATPATDRLYYLASHLDLAGTAMADWKLRLVSVAQAVEVSK